VPLHEPFETALRGFNRQQVLDHIESLDGRISMVVADRESALAQVAELSRMLDHLREESELLAQLRQETMQATKQAERIQQSPIFAASIRAQRIIQLAEEEAADIKARAQQEARELKARADNEVAELKARAGQEITARHQRTTGEAEALLRETAQRCKQREAEFERDIARRVSVAEQKEAEITDTRARISQEVAALEALRAKITTQLSATRQILAEALGQAQQTKIDHPASGRPVPVQRPNGRVIEAGR